MNPERPDLADLFRRHTESYLKMYGSSTSKQQKRVLRDIVACRTSVLGGHISQCNHCGHTEVYYNSCRNRHCPKCQAAARAQWLQERAAELLDVPYFHMVFTLPETLSPIALQNKRVLYGILFRSASETLLTLARDPEYLGADIGFLSLLHTWGQTLRHHPHLHCLVPGGGLSPDGKRWIASHKDFFLPVRVLSRLFQKKFLAYLQEACQKNKLFFHGKLEHLKDHSQWKQLISSLYALDWVVYSKPPFGRSQQILKYLARYTHRVALSNQRLVSLESNHVTFRWKDYADGHRVKMMTLDAVEFIRRFLLHVLPQGFMRIRHYGFLSNRNRKEKLPLCRKLIDRDNAAREPSASSKADTVGLAEISGFPFCPLCKQGRMFIIERLQEDSPGDSLHKIMEAYDTS